MNKILERILECIRKGLFDLSGFEALTFPDPGVVLAVETGTMVQKPDEKRPEMVG